jgi:hypothetical protein
LVCHEKTTLFSRHIDFGYHCSGVVAITALAYNGGKFDKESKEFVDGAVPAIVASWDQQQLLERGTPELRRSITPAKLASLFQNLSRLGSLVNYEGATGEANLSYFTGAGARISASYVAKARFENGSAVFRIALVKHDEHWMINGFHVDPLRSTGQGT